MDAYKLTITPYRLGVEYDDLAQYELYYDHQPSKQQVLDAILTVMGPNNSWCRDRVEEDWLTACYYGILDYGIPYLEGSITMSNIQWCKDNEWPPCCSKGSTCVEKIYIVERP